MKNELCHIVMKGKSDVIQGPLHTFSHSVGKSDSWLLNRTQHSRVQFFFLHTYTELIASDLLMFA